MSVIYICLIFATKNSTYETTLVEDSSVSSKPENFSWWRRAAVGYVNMPWLNMPWLHLYGNKNRATIPATGKTDSKNEPKISHSKAVSSETKIPTKNRPPNPTRNNASKRKPATSPSKGVNSRTNKSNRSGKADSLRTTLHHQIGTPHIFIIGAQKCGTTSLHALIVQHEEICSVAVKEMHYFDRRWEEGSRWYQSKILNLAQTHNCNQSELVIDATPAYIRNVVVPGRFAITYAPEELAKKKFILALREPVSREISWYKHNVRECVQQIQLAVSRNTTRSSKTESPGRNKMNNTRGGSRYAKESVYYRRDICGNSSKIAFCRNVGCHSIPADRTDLLQDPIKSLLTFDDYYLANKMEPRAGFYLEQIKRWLTVIRRDQLFIVHLDSLAKNTTEVMRAMSKFLGLKSDWGDNVVLPHENESPVPYSVSCKVMRELAGKFSEANRGLEEFINSQHAPYEPHFPPLVLDQSMCME